MRPADRFAEVWGRLTAPDESQKALAQTWFVLGMEAAAALVKTHKQVVRLTRPSSDGYVTVVDGAATMLSLYEKIAGCPNPGGG